MDAARIAALLEPFLDRPLASSQLDQVSTYINLLLRWNARINLTAIRKPEEIVPRHFGESFFLARHLFPLPHSVERTLLSAQSGTSHPAPAAHAASQTVVDLGSGAGFPGLPLKIWVPGTHLTLIESNHKKAAFLREAVRALTLTNVDVISERAEDVLADHAAEDYAATSPRRSGSQPAPGTAPSASAHLAAPRHPHFADGIPRSLLPADVVTFRAVERFDKILPTAVRFLSPNGRLALLVSSDQIPLLSAVQNLQWDSINVPKSHKRRLLLGSRVLPRVQ